MKHLFPLVLFICCPTVCPIAQGMDDVVIEAQKVNGNVYILTGQGGNIGVSVGEDGVFVIDDQFAPLTEKIVTTIRTLSDGPIHFLANTHYHGDHTGGNANMADMGVKIIAHDNVRKRLEKTPRRDGSMTPEAAFPIITYNDQMSLYINGERVALMHVSHAHTDGDTMLYFTDSNVLHTGDVYFQGRYPYIDVNSGGSIDGYIAAVEQALSWIDDQTKIIPGHGEVSNKNEYSSFLTMLKALRLRVKNAMDAGKSEEQIIQDESITADYDAQGYGWNFINAERIKRAIFTSLNQ